MNKKIWSFVLAMVLSVGLGAGSLVLADPYEKTGGATSPDWVSNSSSSGSASGYTMTIPDENKAAVGDTESKICTVFNYKAGMLLSVMDQDRNVTIYDAGKARATLGYNDDGTFTVTNFYLTGSDWDKISQMDGNSDGEKLKNFLLSVGIQESALKASKTEEGNVNTDEQVDIAWFDAAADQLKKGINYSVSIDLKAQYGASMTWSVNGKPQETIGYDGTVLETYNYNAAGTLESISKTTYKLKDGQVADSGNNVQFEKTTTTVYLDAYGKQSYAKDAEGHVVTQYSYSSNGSLVSMYSKENEATTYYSGGKTSFTVNDEGFITERYSYHANGSLDGVTSYNFDADDNRGSTKTEITAYKWGRAVGSADLSSGTGVQNFDELRAAVADIKSNPDAVLDSLKSGSKYDSKNSSKYGNITSIAVYECDLNNSKLMKFLFGDNYAAQVNKMKAMSNGYSAVANAEFTIDAIAFETETRDGGTRVEGGSFAAYTESETTREGKEGEQLSIKVTVMDRGGQSYQINGAKHTLREAVNAIVTVTTVKDPAVEGTLFPSENTTEEEIIAMAESLGIDVNDEEAMADLRNGFYTDKETGKTYAIVNAENVNIMDGTGFQAANGETILVEVTEDVKDAIVKSGEKKVMFMGDVRSDVNGYLTMAINTNYSGGFATGSDISAIKDAIQNEELDWVKTNTAANQAVFGNGGARVDWQAGWDILTGKTSVNNFANSENEEKSKAIIEDPELMF